MGQIRLTKPSQLKYESSMLGFALLGSAYRYDTILNTIWLSIWDLPTLICL